MRQHVEGPRKTFKAGTTLEAFRRVKIIDATTSPKTVGYAGATDMAIGVTEQYHASGADCTIYLANAQGTRKMTASVRRAFTSRMAFLGRHSFRNELTT